MNPQVKEKWVNALRSGEYSQCDGKLRSADGFCCLGVLCDLYSQEPFTKGWVSHNVYDKKNAQPQDY